MQTEYSQWRKHEHNWYVVLGTVGNPKLDWLIRTEPWAMQRNSPSHPYYILVWWHRRLPVWRALRHVCVNQREPKETCRWKKPVAGTVNYCMPSLWQISICFLVSAVDLDSLGELPAFAVCMSSFFLSTHHSYMRLFGQMLCSLRGERFRLRRLSKG